MPRSKRLIGAVTLGLALLLDAAAANAQRMYWADRGTHRIQSARLDGTDVQNVIVNHVEQPAGIALDVAGGRMYWVDRERATIQRARLDGSDVEDLVHASVSPLPDLVLDPGGGRMYWAEQGTIRRARLDGTNAEVLVTGQFGPTGPALDPAAGKLYWNDNDRIQRANLDGSGVELLVTTGAPLFNQSAVTLHLGGGKMYWIASLTLYQPARIQRANLDGSRVEDLVLGARTSVGPTLSVALDVSAGKMYWADDTFPWGVRRANLDGSNLEKVVTTTAGEPKQLALDTGAGKMYWVIDSPPAKIQRANLDGSNIEDVVTTGLTAPGRLGLNPGAGKLYWSDFNARRIERADLDGANREDLVSALVRSPDGLVIDSTEDKIYWADLGKVYRASLDGSNVETFISTGSGFPGTVALDPLAGKLYWTVPGDRIRRANRDGSEPEDVVSTGGWAIGLAVDPAGHKIYWTEAFGSRVRRANLDGSDVQELITGSLVQGPIDVDPVAGKLYWAVGTASPAIHRANLDGSNAEPVIPVVGARGMAVDRNTHQIYWTSPRLNFDLAAIMRAGPSGVQTLVQEGLNDPWGIALNVPLVPMAGTGFVRSAPASGFDSFAHVFEAVPGTKAVGRIGSSLGALKDVDVDPTTGVIYAIDFLPGGLGQQVYVIDPATGAGTPLPNPTGLTAPALIWGLAFDAGGTLYGGGLGVYRIDKSTGRASLLADVTRVPALILGLAASPTDTGFLSSGLLLAPGASLPYLAQHTADGTFVPDRVFLLTDPYGPHRVLLDIGLSESGFLYGTAWPASLLANAVDITLHPTAANLQQALATAQASTREALEAEARDKIARILEAQAAPDAKSDLVLVHLAVRQNMIVAAMTRGAPLDALLLGIGRTIPAPPSR